MGSDQSLPVSTRTGSPFFCLVFRVPNKIRLVQAPKEVVDTVARIMGEVGGETFPKDKFGCSQFKLPGNPFYLGVGKDSSTVGKLFGIRIMEELHNMGYDIVCSADLARQYDNSTWFFAKNQNLAERSHRPVVCVAPGGHDKLVIVKGDVAVVASVRNAVEEAWSKGIQDERTSQTKYGEVFEFKLRGNPWFQSGEQSAMCRRTLLSIISHMSRSSWRLLSATNLKGGTDSMFFIREDNQAILMPGRELAMVSLNRHDRVRLINFDESAKHVVRSSITRAYQNRQPKEREYHGAYEFEVEGSPFHCSGEKAVASRRLICALLADLSAHGWDCIETLDVSRKLTDKSVFVFRHSQPMPDARFGCIALTDTNHLRLIDFPPATRDALLQALMRGYAPSLANQKEDDPFCLKLYLNGHPWANSNYSTLHGRGALLALLEEAAQHGWYLKASADVSAKYVSQENGPDYPLDVHSWFFCHYSAPAATQQVQQFGFGL